MAVERPTVPYPGVPSRPHGPSRIRRIVGRVGLTGLILGSGGVAGYEYLYNTAFHESVDSLGANLAGRWNSLTKISEPSKGDVFNPNAGKGEITPSNSKTFSLKEALALIAIQTNKDNRRYVPLPDTADRQLIYEVKSLQYAEMTGIKGFVAGDAFISPYDAVLTWARYEKNGAMTIELRRLQPSIPGIATNQEQIEYVVQDAKLSIPDSAFNTNKTGPTGAATIYSSEVPVKAGQSIFTLTSDRTVPGSYADIGSYQVVINGARILADSDTVVKVATTP